MQNIFSHLAYLLTRHECVIIPGFGAFVVSSVHAKKTKDSGVFCPPAQILGFNPELKHNDGILANSISKEKNISYKEANLLIRQFTDEIQIKLNAGEIISIAGIGKLSLSPENKIVFTPDSHPTSNSAYYGFTNFYLPLLKEIETSLEQPVLIKKVNKDVIWVPLNRRILNIAGSVAAAVLALFLVSTPVNNHTKQSVQYADILSISSSLLETKTPEAGRNPLDSLSLADSISTLNPTIAPASTRQYYIVVASLPSKETADEMLAKIQPEFKNAEIISSDGKHRIYVHRLENKDEAENFLLRFRSEHPKHQNAWLLSQRIKS